MFMSVTRPAVEPRGPDVVAVPGSPAITLVTARALHARLLANAAMRRLRGLERKRSRRDEDASYWFSAVPVAVRKASELRLCARGFALLP